MAQAKSSATGTGILGKLTFNSFNFGGSGDQSLAECVVFSGTSTDDTGCAGLASAAITKWVN